MDDTPKAEMVVDLGDDQTHEKIRSASPLSPDHLPNSDSTGFEIPHSEGRDGFFDYREEKTMHNVGVLRPLLF